MRILFRLSHDEADSRQKELQAFKNLSITDRTHERLAEWLEANAPDCVFIEGIDLEDDRGSFIRTLVGIDRG